MNRSSYERRRGELLTAESAELEPRSQRKANRKSGLRCLTWLYSPISAGRSLRALRLKAFGLDLGIRYWVRFSQETCQPCGAGQHSAPSQETHDAGDQGVVLQYAQIGENRVPIVLGKFGIAQRDQRQFHHSRIGHVSCGVNPILEKEEKTEDESGNLPLVKEVNRQQQRHQP